MKKFIYLFLAFCFILSCGTKGGKVEKIMEKGVEVIVNHLEPYKVKNEPTKMILEEEFSIDTEKFKGEEIVSIGAFDTDKEGNLYIFDTELKKILKFDNKGNLVGTIGREGQGPGEFQFVTNLRINAHGEIIATDNNKFSFFSKDGNLIKEIKINFRIFEGIILENGNYLFRKFKEPDSKTKVGRQVISLYDSEFKKIKELDEIEMFNPFGDKIKGIYFNLPFDVSGEKIFTANQERGYEIHVYDLEGNLIKKIKKEYKKIHPSEEYKKNFIEMFESGFYNFIKNKLYFPDVLPPFHYFLCDEQGRIFVQTYEQGKNPGEYIFDIFDSEGVFIARKSLKDFSESQGLNGKFTNGHFYFVLEKESGYEKLMAYRVIWEK